MYAVPDNKLVVLFDGVCNFCNSSVNFIIDRDVDDKFLFASLQSEFGQEMLKKFNLPAESFSTLILIEGEKYYTRSSAALRIAKRLRFPYPLLYIYIVWPPFLRDFFYDVISRNRYKFSGKRIECRYPTPDMQSKFID